MKKRRKVFTSPGFYGMQDDKSLVGPLAAVDRPPDVCVSRRVVDFPHGRPPIGAVLTSCRDCGAAIASDGKFPGVPRICLQCAGIEPLPIEGSPYGQN